MIPCAAMNDELIGVSLGEVASETLSIHLTECRACASKLERQRVLAQRMDGAVNALVRAEPPSRLLESISARFRSGQRPRTWTGARPEVAVGAALAASVIGLMLGLRAPQPPVTPAAPVALTAWRSPTDALLESRGSVLEVPLNNVWLNLEPRPSHFRPNARRYT